MRTPFSLVIPAAVLAFAGGLTLDLGASRAVQPPRAESVVDPAVMKAYQWRSIRGNIMPGDGMYKSTDAGKTWTHIGFGKTSVDATWWWN